MTAVEVLRLPLDTDLSGFVALLQRLNVPHRVAEEGGQQVLWVPDEQLAEQVRDLYARHPQGYAGGEVPASAAPGCASRMRARTRRKCEIGRAHV